MSDNHLPELPKAFIRSSAGHKWDKLRYWLRSCWKWIAIRNMLIAFGLSGFIWFSVHCVLAINPILPKGQSISDLIAANRPIVYQGMNYYVPNVSGLYLDSERIRQYRSELLNSQPIRQVYYYGFYGGNLSDVENQINVEIVHLDDVFAVACVSPKNGADYELFAGLELPMWKVWVLTTNGWKYHADHFSLAQALTLRDSALSRTMALNLQFATSSSLARK